LNNRLGTALIPQFGFELSLIGRHILGDRHSAAEQWLDNIDI
jgi:hypothetical protein